MKNKWTTLVEEHTDKADQVINDVLKGSEHTSAHTQKNKRIAIVLASIGILLIGVGVTPFVKTNLNANLLDENSSTIFETSAESANDFVLEPEPEEEVETIPSLSFGDFEGLLPIDESLGAEETIAPVAVSTEDSEDVAPLSDADTETVAPVVVSTEDSEDVAPLSDVDTETVAPVVVSTEDSEDVAPLSDADTKAETISEEEMPIIPDTFHSAAPEIAQTSGANSTETVDEEIGTFAPNPNTVAAEDAMHAAPSTADSGPEVWAFLLLALGCAFMLRRKELLG